MVQGSEENKKEIQRRLNRIEGQVKGISRMIEEEKSCVDVLTQIAAVRSAISKVGGLILERYSAECIVKSVDSDDRDAELHQLMDTIQRFLRFVD